MGHEMLPRKQQQHCLSLFQRKERKKERKKQEEKATSDVIEYIWSWCNMLSSMYVMFLRGCDKVDSVVRL
jgi:hypothetical protein